MTTTQTLRRRLAWRLVDLAEVVLGLAHRTHATAPASLDEYADDLKACDEREARRQSAEAMRSLHRGSTGEDQEMYAKAAAMVGVELEDTTATPV